MKNNPKISIISPSYNQGKFIEDAILSILNQGYDNFEHIIIDGGSDDDTISILKKYPHLIWVSEKDNGQSDAINKGFERATGDIIGWLNTDDYYLPETFSTILETFSHNQTDVVYGDIIFVNKNKEYQRTVKSHLPIKWLSLFHCYIHSAAFFCKRKILDEGVRIDPKMHIIMDKELFAHILHKEYKLKYIKKTLTAFRWHDTNKSIDTDEVKKIRYREGLIIFSRYSRINLPINSFTIFIYKYLLISLLPFRKVLLKLT